MKVLVIGGSGLLGKKLRDILLEHNYDVYTTYYRAHPIDTEKNYQLDITQKKDVDSVIKKITPDVIVHTAALTNVDECEKNQDLADNINTQGTKYIAETAKKIGSKLLYVSTDYVFDGKKGLYKEEDHVRPINYYGVTKQKGEEVVKNIVDDCIIVRPSVIYGSSNKKNFVLWILDNLQRQKRMNIVNDQYVSPTLNTDLSEQVVALIKNDVQGVFHTAGGERINRYAFSQIVADVFHLDKTLIKAISMKDMNWVAQRPKDSSLDVSKVTSFKKPYKVRKAVSLLKEEIGRLT
jgi:dTDP-4-dehydrorhamnose reductase